MAIDVSIRRCEFRIFILILFKVPQKEENWSSLVVCFLLFVVCWLFGGERCKDCEFSCVGWFGCYFWHAETEPFWGYHLRQARNSL